MRIGVVHQWCMPGRWETVIAQAGELGFEGVEVTVRLDDVAELWDHPERVASLRAAAERARVALPSLCQAIVGRELRLGDTDPAGRAKAVGMVGTGIRRCAELGGKVTLVPGAASLADLASADAYVKSLKELAAIAEKAQVQVAIETGYSAAETLDVLGRVGSPWVGDYLDVGNVAGRGWDPVQETLGRKGHVFQVHVKGTRGVDLDAGTVDIPAVYRALQSIGYDGWLMLETPPGGDAVESARRNLAALKRYVA